MQDYLMIGTILKPQGIHGECKIKPYAADLDFFREWKTLYLCDRDVFSPLPCRVTRIHDGFVYAVLGECASADDAELLRGRDLFVDRAHAAQPGENETLIADLIGCHAVTADGRDLGILTDVLQHATVDTWVFRSSRGEWMAPALLEAFPQVDAAGRRITVNEDRLREVAVFED
ncbi:MAG: 16S rRNA processing protein RimM [Clostridia bacterium]|nr:16S rRNA processing protein RimM [Clostridia bacterium]